ncbi:hypothetical protein CDD83_3251 [Cordyceps sp. RAO-2017]|nr:hypothetical protein CDD83_3251 [Cordyceps sp. RAO-2017]
MSHLPNTSPFSRETPTARLPDQREKQADGPSAKRAPGRKLYHHSRRRAQKRKQALQPPQPPASVPTGPGSGAAEVEPPPRARTRTGTPSATPIGHRIHTRPSAQPLPPPSKGRSTNHGLDSRAGPPAQSQH